MFKFREWMVLSIVLIGVNSSTQAKTVEELKNAGDLRGLVDKLSDRQAAVRRDAAVALPGVAEKVNDSAVLNSVIGRLIEVRMSDPWKSTREYSGRALMYALNKTKDQRVLNDSVSPLLDALDRGQVEVAFHDPWKSTRGDCSGTLEHLLKKTENQRVLRGTIQPILDALPHSQVDSSCRHYAATMLYLVSRRLDNVGDLLGPRIPEMLSAVYSDPNEHVREYVGRALGNVLNNIDDEKTLSNVAHYMVADQRLKSGDERARRYSADHLYNLVRKIKDQPTHRALLGRITAATKDRDERVREAADRVKCHIENVLKVKKPVATKKA